MGALVPMISVQTLKKTLVYSECGVSPERNDYWVKKLSKMDVTDGGFASLWEEDDSFWVSSTDGIGSKLILAKECRLPNWLYLLGQDLVAMIVNDISTTGALPSYQSSRENHEVFSFVDESAN